MEQLFFSKENFGIIYNILRNKLNTTSSIMTLIQIKI